MDRLRSIAEEYEYEITDQTIAANAARYTFFADYMIWSWAWAIDCGDDENRGRVAAICGNERFVADNFSAFVDRYVEDVGKVCP